MGKTSIVERLGDVRAFHSSVSATTRAPRDGEVHGRHYFFFSDEEFKQRIDDGDFLEWAVYADHLKGTPRQAVDRWLNAGVDVILTIDIQGAQQVKESGYDPTLVFVAPPSLDALAERLQKRGDTDAGDIARRLEIASTEIAQSEGFDHVVVNDELDRAVAEIASILESSELSERPPK